MKTRKSYILSKIEIGGGPSGQRTWQTVLNEPSSYLRVMVLANNKGGSAQIADAVQIPIIFNTIALDGDLGRNGYTIAI